MTKIQAAAEAMIRCTNQCYPRDEKDPWKNLDARQVLVDCLHALQYQGLIKDYNLLTGKVVI